MGFPQDPLKNSGSSLEYMLQYCRGTKENAQCPRLLVPKYFLSHDGISIAVNPLPFSLKIIGTSVVVQMGESGHSRCKTFCYHLCLVVTFMISYLGFPMWILFLPPGKSLSHLWLKEGVIGRH